MVEIRKGQTDKNASSDSLINFFRANDALNGKLYIGYPILYSGGESSVLDALWISPEYGVLVFDLIEGTIIKDREEDRDNLFTKLSSLLGQYPELNKKRRLQVDINVLTFAPACANIDYTDTATTEEEVSELIAELNSWVNPELFTRTVAVIQSVIQIKTKIDRSFVKRSDSRGFIIKNLEETIANLDNQQEEAVIEFHDGLQRIRGLAGSGKTIVLALKAAYLHAINPEWNIAVTFNTRALKTQFYEMIELFCIQKMGQKPDESKIRIIQAWGSGSNTGIYYEFCKDNNIEYLDYRDGKIYSNKVGKQPFDAVCRKALDEVDKDKVIKKYDAILVDEAQDLSESFLNICYMLLTKKKRLIYAYDELQKLNEGSSLRSPRKIFGKDASDTILKKCYRNSRPVLVTAHALGFGIYRKAGLAQFFDQPELWSDLGYKVKDGMLKAGHSVTLYRPDEASHKYLEDNVDIDDLIIFKSFKSKTEQSDAIVKDIIKNLKEDELLHRDIIVINPMALTTKDEVYEIRYSLTKAGIKNHIAGDSNPDNFFEKESITFTGINRAKGNEVPMVYIINAQECYSHPILHNLDLIKRRNILFTAITRSKAWVRVYGIGERMESLTKEFKDVKNKDFELDFIYPDSKTIQKMNLISRDISKKEELQYEEEIKSLSSLPQIIQRIKAKESNIEDYPKELRPFIKKLIEEDEN
ncbi:DEAD/DEAH box helicase [Mucilaginibacter sp. SG564]|uniref:DEAD/DEAH box helicase n=1 Tax=Mucilaginibacter sp. SG564 TaxID=2587022 RepID=UPI00155550D7|nr:ATP-binding domain-containing protein [Mucilaginibacter sp. SG564]NOW96587.1 superfamily I DNA and RNA helicase [Mucilaginibacter sp. SG564]